MEGFQTGVKRIPIPKELAERIKRGDQVSGEEITAAQEREKLASASASSGKKSAKKGSSSAAATPNRKLPAGVDQGWLPETTTRTSSVKKSKTAPETPEPTRRSPRKRAQG